jgi:hypothetical protein
MFLFLPTGSVYVFRMMLTINSDYFPKKPQPVGVYTGHAVGFLRDCFRTFISAMALQPFVGPWPLQFCNLFHTDGRTPCRVISPSRGRYLHTGQHKHRINAHTEVHALSGIRTPRSQHSSERRQFMP